MGALILVVDDDELVRESLRWNLERQGHRVDTAASGEEGLLIAQRERPGLVILDVGLPGIDGFETCRKLQAQYELPVILLTGRADEVDRVSGLRLGADDYVTKPFSMPELAARVQAVLRRTQHQRDESRAGSDGERPGRLAFGDVLIDVPGHEVTRRGQSIHVAPREFDLLVALVCHPGQVLRRDQVLDLVWGTDWIGEPKTLDVHMQWLRAKLEDDPANPRHLVTVRGVGYKFVP